MNRLTHKFTNKERASQSKQLKTKSHSNRQIDSKTVRIRKTKTDLNKQADSRENKLTNKQIRKQRHEQTDSQTKRLIDK